MIQFTEEKPIWRQIYELIAMRILSGEWAEMERIVSVREMAAAVGVNPNTVMRSYEKLEADGIIFNRRGIGFFVSEGAKDHIKQLEYTFSAGIWSRTVPFSNALTTNSFLDIIVWVVKNLFNDNQGGMI